MDKDTEVGNIPYKLKKTEFLNFFHIPKTGGTSLINIIDNYFDLENILIYQVWNHLLPVSAKNFSKIKFVRGHFGYTISNIIKKLPIRITMVREPVDHVISYYNHIKREPIDNRWIPSNFFSENESLEDILIDENKNMIFRNSQTQHLALSIDMMSKDKNKKNTKKELFYEFELSKKAEMFSDNELLELAINNLKKFKFIGLVEKYYESLCLLWYIFGWKPINTIPKFQEDPFKNKHRFSHNIISLIKKNTKLDQKLYDYVKNRFDLQYKKMINDLKEKYSVDEKLSKNEKIKNQLEKNYVKVYWNNEKALTKLQYDFSRKIFGSGWHSREKFQNTKKIFRWSGPENISIIDLPRIKGIKGKIKCSCVNYLLEKNVNELQSSINGSKIPIFIKYKKQKQFLIESEPFVLPKGNFFRIQFKIPQTVSPKSIRRESNDGRKLGFALHGIDIENIKD